MTARLTDADRGIIARSRKLADAGATLDALREHTGERDVDVSYACAFGEARHLLAELAAIADRLGDDEGQAAEDTRRLGEVRDVLATSGQYPALALNAIERIVDGGEA